MFSLRCSWRVVVKLQVDAVTASGQEGVNCTDQGRQILMYTIYGLRILCHLSNLSVTLWLEPGDNQFLKWKSQDLGSIPESLAPQAKSWTTVLHHNYFLHNTSIWISGIQVFTEEGAYIICSNHEPSCLQYSPVRKTEGYDLSKGLLKGWPCVKCTSGI